MHERDRRIGGIVMAMFAIVGGGWLLIPSGQGDIDRTDRPLLVVAADAPEIRLTHAPARPAAPVANAAAGRDTPLIARIVRHATPDFRLLSALVDADARDATIAAPIESAMTREFHRIPGLSSSEHPVHVRCVTTTCEITGHAAAGRSRADVELALQETDLLNRMMAQGYSPGPLEVDATDPGRIGFVFYLNREV